MSPVIVDVDGESSGWRGPGEGEAARGGVFGRVEKVGVGGTSANLGCGVVSTTSCTSVCIPTETLLRFFLGVFCLAGAGVASLGPDTRSAIDSSISLGQATAGAAESKSWSWKVFSSFFRSIHHIAPAASQAFDRTECTICAVSRPSEASVLSNCRSGGVVKITGVRAESSVWKSRSREAAIGNGVGVFSVVGEPDSDIIDETDRRFVRAGVRTGWEGGGALALNMSGDGACFLGRSSCPSSMTVAGCLSIVFANRDDTDSKSDAANLRIVESL